MSALSSDSSQARFRVEPEDFVVEELALVEPTGRGDHTWLWVEKRLRDTDEVARELAKLAGVAAGEVGFAGRKDRRAVTRQWFSVPRVAPEMARDWELAGARVLAAARHRERLQLGELAANRFDLRLRGVTPAAAAAALARLKELGRRGCPNSFGDQRFGKDGGNARRGAALLAGERVGGDLRHLRFLLSAFQSELFNEVLRRRPWPWDELVPGDLAMAAASGRLIPIETPEAGSERLLAFAVSPTGPLVGSKMPRPGGEVGALEAALLAERQVPDPDRWRLPKNLRLFGERRPLRFPVRAARTKPEGEDLVVSFELPAGAYATTVLGEMFVEGLEEVG